MTVWLVYTRWDPFEPWELKQVFDDKEKATNYVATHSIIDKYKYRIESRKVS